jgi:hypothetical protein
MKLSEAVIRALQGKREGGRQLALEFAATAKGPHNISVRKDGLVIDVLAEDTGRYGVRLRGIRVAASTECNRQDRLVAGVSTRVSTPYGPLICMEGDDERSRAVLRTHQVGEASSYYEAVVTGGGEIALSHYTVPVKTAGREETPVDLGMDMFRVMLVDLVEVAQAPTTHR